MMPSIFVDNFFGHKAFSTFNLFNLFYLLTTVSLLVMSSCTEKDWNRICSTLPFSVNAKLIWMSGEGNVKKSWVETRRLFLERWQCWHKLWHWNRSDIDISQDDADPEHIRIPFSLVNNNNEVELKKHWQCFWSDVVSGRLGEWWTRRVVQFA